ncbi:hypothetical protein BC829DRAFT_396784 [Chytridium lagenaria]|nr:hypothetical protein BC829DRAFT_396784 [Chytridium lagenaria]
MQSSPRTHPLYPLPLEIVHCILRFTNDLDLSIKLESLLLHLPATHPDDPLSSFTQFPVDTPSFPISKHLSGILDCIEPLHDYQYAHFVSGMSDLGVAWMHRFGGKTWSPKCTSCLAWYGRLSMLKWLHQQQSPTFTKATMNDAATHGHLHVVQFLHEHRTEGCTTVAMNNAASYGHLDVIKFLHHHRKEGCSTSAMDFAARL